MHFERTHLDTPKAVEVSDRSKRSVLDRKGVDKAQQGKLQRSPLPRGSKHLNEEYLANHVNNALHRNLDFSLFCYVDP